MRRCYACVTRIVAHKQQLRRSPQHNNISVEDSLQHQLRQAHAKRWTIRVAICCGICGATAQSLRCARFRSEAAALLGTEGLTAEQAALALGPLCDMAIVTDGANGSCISALGTLHVRLRGFAETVEHLELA